MSDDLLMRAIAWRNGEHTGLSSVALVSHLMGWPNSGKRKGDDRRHPDYPGAFERCHLALKKLPELRARLDEARSLSLMWDLLIDRWPELEALCEAKGAQEGYKEISALMESVYDLLCPICCNGELEWSDEWHAKCKNCGDESRRRDPRIPEPEALDVSKPVTVSESIRDNLIAGYLLLDVETGDVISEGQDCEECDGEGTVECVCDECDDEHTKDCEECDGAGKCAVTWDFEQEPDVNEGETAIIAIFDKRNLHGPRIAYESAEVARHALTILLEQPDSVLASMFTERRAA